MHSDYSGCVSLYFARKKIKQVSNCCPYVLSEGNILLVYCSQLSEELLPQLEGIFHQINEMVSFVV